MKKLICSRSNDAYDTIVEGIVDTIEYHPDYDEYHAYVYSEELEKSPYDFYQGVVVFEPLSADEVALDLHEGDRVKLGVILSKDDYGYDDDIVDIISKEN